VLFPVFQNAGPFCRVTDLPEVEFEANIPAVEESASTVGPASGEAIIGMEDGQACDASCGDAMSANPQDESGDNPPLGQSAVDAFVFNGNSTVASGVEEGSEDDPVPEVNDVSMCGFAASGVVSPRNVSPLRRNGNGRVELLDKGCAHIVVANMQPGVGSSRNHGHWAAFDYLQLIRSGLIDTSRP
jgi:hypothetical protein